MIAGTETTATALSGGLFYLLQNPEWVATLIRELRGEYNSVGSLTMSSLQSNPALNAVLQESLRIYPPLPAGTPRIVSNGAVELNGYFIPEGTRVAFYHAPTYRDEQSFHRPDGFRPERWLGDPEFKHDRLDACEPFSVGPRNCIGKIRLPFLPAKQMTDYGITTRTQSFAWHEMRLLLATILIHFDITLLPESKSWRHQDGISCGKKSH